MTPDDIQWPALYTAGTAIFFGPSDNFGQAYFGGPLEHRFTGIAFGPASLHRIFTFSPAYLPQPAGHKLQGNLSLFYGMRFGGCTLRYKVPVMGGVGAQYIGGTKDETEILEIDPVESSNDWPYHGYPEFLPYVPLSESNRVNMPLVQFLEELTWQGLEDPSEDDMIIVVPACPRLGVSIWGRMGDEEAVQLVFRYNYRTFEVTATNQCT